MGWITKSVFSSFVLCLIFHDVISVGLPENKFRVDEAIVNVPENPYVEKVEVFIEDEGFSVTINSTITKTFPEDMTVKAEVQFEGVDLPVFEMLLCPAMHDQIFVNDVLTKGHAANPPFPSACPINSNRLSVSKWQFPHYKIPTPTPPGSVNVNVEIFTPGQHHVMVLKAKGTVVKDVNVGKMLGVGK